LAAGANAQNASPPPTDPAELDPSAPLAPMPDLGVEWPDLNAKEPPPAVLPTPSTGKPATAAPTAASPSTRRGRATSTVEGQGIHYSWTIEGLGSLAGSEDLLKAFRQQSALEHDRKDKANAAQIDRRSRADADLLAQLLRSQGYYDAVVEARTEGSGDQLSVVLDADAGSRYHFASVDLPGLGAAGEDARALRTSYSVKAGDPVVAQNVIDANLALTRALGENGFAEARVGDQDIEVNHQTHLATLVLPVIPGPVAHFGKITVTGQPPFSARHVGIIARFKPGDRFQRSKIDDLRRALIQTTLVANADIKLVPVDGGRVVDLAVRLEPAPRHTIAGELGYGTGQGIRAEVDWTDRNFFNPEGAITLRGVIGTKEQLAAIQYRRNNFIQRDQVLNLQASAGHQQYDAYEAKTLRLAGNIERQSNFIWQKTWTWSYGGEILGTDERGVFNPDRMKETRKFAIAAIPLSIGYDGSDNLLDPTRGFRLSGWISPEVSAHGGKFIYARTQIDASAYHPVSNRVVVAGRVRFGTIVGASVFDIAPSRRFYSGGGGSVRGYGYQQLGPRDVDGDPMGGRGLAEFSLETRVRLKSFGGNFGIVPFVDGGTLTTKAVPDFNDWRFAVGLGARYYSSFGPIRIDLGVPLNRQKGDGPIAVTVSLGQAF
jgi:translocation and assembly module TamA